MNKTRAWIEAFRLRTLPLAFSCILLGNLLAKSHGYFHVWILVLSLTTTLFIQILSNLANDYGDGIKGTDDHRIGPRRTVQSGLISQKEMKNALVVFTLLTFISGVVLTWLGTKDLSRDYLIFFILLGIGAIIAAITYTVGKRAYGYHGLGDVFVFIFFGLVGVGGAYFLQANSLRWEVLLPAASVGMLSVGVLNLNNMRDIETDLLAGKHTIAVKMGIRRAKIYHGVLLLGAIALAMIYINIGQGSSYQWIFVVSLLPILANLKKVMNIQDPQAFDPLLKQLALGTLLFSLTFGLGQILS